MTRAELLALAARVEQTTGADQAINEQVAEAAGWRVKAADGLRYWRKGDKSWTAEMDGVPPNFLEDLNAAVSLVPAGAFWRVGHDGEGPDPSRFYATVLNRHQWHGRADTPALALTAAAIRAMAGEAGDE